MTMRDLSQDLFCYQESSDPIVVLILIISFIILFFASLGFIYFMGYLVRRFRTSKRGRNHECELS